MASRSSPCTAASSGVEFLSSPFDRQAVDELDAFDVGAFKIASFELVDLPFIRYAAAKGRPLILSTGMATLGEIEDAVTAAREAGARRSRCCSARRSIRRRRTIMNLRSIPAMRHAFGVPVGLSDHTRGTHIAVAAVALGACIVEKHFTLDRIDAPVPIIRSRPSRRSSASSSRTSATSRPRSATA